MDFAILNRHGRIFKISCFLYGFRKTPRLAGIIERFIFFST